MVRWFATGAAADVDPGDLRAFMDEDLVWSRRLVLGLVGLLGGALALYPLEDRWAFAAMPQTLPVLARARLELIGIGVATAIGVVAFPRAARAVAAVGGALAMWRFTAGLGDLGGPSTPWL